MSSTLALLVCRFYPPPLGEGWGWVLHEEVCFCAQPPSQPSPKRGRSSFGFLLKWLRERS